MFSFILLIKFHYRLVITELLLSIITYTTIVLILVSLTIVDLLWQVRVHRQKRILCFFSGGCGGPLIVSCVHRQLVMHLELSTTRFPVEDYFIVLHNLCAGISLSAN